MRIESPAFRDGEAIPDRYAYAEQSVSPPLEWGGVPKNAESLALVVEDPDAPSGTFGHWILYNLSPDIARLDDGAGRSATRTAGGEQGLNDFGEVGYGGPRPPSGTHRYFFRLFALDTRLGLEGQPRRADLLDAVKGHVLAEAKLMGTYTKS